MTEYTGSIDRRTVLASSAIAITGLAGCVTDDIDDENGTGGPGENDNDDNGNGNAGPSDDPAIESASIETTGTDCGDPDDDSVTEFSPDEDSVDVEGVLPAPNPCHAATLEAASVDGEKLALTIDVEQDLPDDEECVECHGAVEYVVSVGLAEDIEITELHVDHATGGSIGIAEERVTDRDDSSEERDDAEEDGDHEDDSGVEEGHHEIGSKSIETIDTDCGSTGDATVTPETDRVVIDGTIVASNPCHEAVLSGAAVSGDELRVAIDVESTLEPDEVCIECVGAIEYRVIVEVTDAKQLSSVHVDHVDGGSYATGWDSVSDSDRED